jgi:hypothetical protein
MRDRETQEEKCKSKIEGKKIKELKDSSLVWRYIASFSTLWNLRKYLHKC